MTALVLAVSWTCTAPYSAKAYRAHDSDAPHATICHANRRTLNVPAEEWPAHKAHGDYRGPCRPRGVPLAGKEPSPRHTDVDYRNRKARKSWSREEWERYQAAKLAAPPATREVRPD